MVKNEDDNGGWSKSERFVEESIKDLKAEAKDLKEKQALTDIEIALLKLKCSFWGAVSGAAMYLITLGIDYLKRKP